MLDSALWLPKPIVDARLWESLYLVDSRVMKEQTFGTNNYQLSCHLLPTRLTSRFIPEHEFRFARITPFFGFFKKGWKVKPAINQLFFIGSHFRKEYFVTLDRALRGSFTDSEPFTVGSARNHLIWSIKSVSDGLACRMGISTIVSYLGTLHLQNGNTLRVCWNIAKYRRGTNHQCISNPHRYYFQPCFHWSLFFKSCQLMPVCRWLITASKTHNMTDPSSS